MARRKKRLNPLRKHHITPRSRIPHGLDKDTDNIVLIPEEFHAAWHQVFGNLTPSEAHEFIDLIMRPGSSWTWGDIKNVREWIMEERERQVA